MPVQADTGLVSKLVEKGIEEEVVTAIKAAWHGLGDPLSPSPQASGRYLPRVLAIRTERKAKLFLDAMNRLMATGRVVNRPKRKGKDGLCAIEDVPKKGSR